MPHNDLPWMASLLRSRCQILLHPKSYDQNESQLEEEEEEEKNEGEGRRKSGSEGER